MKKQALVSYKIFLIKKNKCTVEAMQSPNDLGSGDPMQNDKCDAVEEIDDIKEGEKEVVFGRENL